MTKAQKKYHKLTTSDDVEIAGNYVPGSLPFGAVLLHMMPADKESYSDFADLLSEAGIHSLAIDFRGHGESAGGSYKEFSDAQHQNYAIDLETAVGYLKQQNPNMKVGLVGASIGANIAIHYAAENPVSFLVLLSPGINYHGVAVGEAVAKLPENLPVYFVTSIDDDRVAGNSTQTETLYNLCTSQAKSINIFKSGGHGTDILKKHPNFARDLVGWINSVKI